MAFSQCHIKYCFLIIICYANYYNQLKKYAMRKWSMTATMLILIGHTTEFGRAAKYLQRLQNLPSSVKNSALYQTLVVE